MPNDRAALGAFLRSRRDRLTPSQAGIEPFPGARRVPGLRKDELAVAAGMSPDYYSRLEQGRQRNVSSDVLDALARALRLDEVERAHLHDLAAPLTRSPSAGPRAGRHPDAGLLRVMRTLDHVPVLLLGRRGEVLARNALLTEVLGSPLEPGASFVRFMFRDPAARARIVNWSDFASATVATMRRETARHPDDRRLTALMDELRSTDADVARWWEDQTVRDYASVEKHVRHPTAGPMSFAIEVVGAPHEPDQRLVVYTAEPGSPTAHALAVLAGSNAVPRH
ncbi:helix-turn-helix transcriptional regulator [Streptomyces sp. NPDC001068]|uniref:helix-turn-helix transcriptional regulator n=1 Tax=Streptomyces sp. NPDC001068 TaxID=3364544 RepID=UPI0036BD43E5